jgi:hypothetical protein
VKRRGLRGDEATVASEPEPAAQAPEAKREDVGVLDQTLPLLNGEPQDLADHFDQSTEPDDPELVAAIESQL